MNVQGRLTAASLATQAPGGKIVAARFIRLIPSACRGGAEPASQQAVPSARIPAGRPGQPSTPHQFSAGPGWRFSALAFSYIHFAVQRYSSKSAGGQVWAGPAENCRRISARPREPAGMRVQGAFCRDATSRPARSPGGISGGDCEATIFRAGSRDCKGRGEERPLHVHRNQCFREMINMR